VASTETNISIKFPSAVYQIH